jgi:hypothetical protein
MTPLPVIMFQSEQLVNMFFCELQKSAAETPPILNVVYENKAVKKYTVYD